MGGVAVRRIAIGLVGLALGAPALADPVHVGTPDGRVSLFADGNGSPSGGYLHVWGNAGAYGTDHTLEGDQSHFRFTNPFWGRELSCSSSGCEHTYQELFQPPTARATMGVGGITEGVDGSGRLTVLGWPGPGLFDQVDFLSLTRGGPNQGAKENAGSFGGARVKGQAPTWIHPGFGWSLVSQRYAAPDTETLVTTMARGDLEVTITDVVDPLEDLVARNFRFSSPVSDFAYFANMNPTTQRLAEVPSAFDTALDPVSDFATVYDGARSTLLAFRPYRVDPVSLTRLATGQTGAGEALEAASGAFGSGVYIAIGGQGAARGWQAGLDAAGLVRAEAEGTPALDAYYDFLDDGGLSLSQAAFGETTGALALPPDRDGSFTVYVSAADDAADAGRILDRARIRGFEGMRTDADAWWRSWIGRARLPSTSDAQAREVAARALMLIRTAMDRRSGAIVAAATTQPPYRQDWVRDGAFFNYALLMAGYPELAIQHALFYSRIYRTGGTWDSFYFPDGAESGVIWPYEIDSQGFALWALWLPYEFGAAGREYLARVYPAIRDTAEALLLCRDPSSGLNCPAAEDDAYPPYYFTQGTQGASIVHLALRTAARAAAALGLDETARDRWAARAEELRKAAIERLCDGNGCGTGRGGVYMAWPGRVLEGELLQRHLAGLAALTDRRAGHAEPGIGGGFNYPMEPLLAILPFWRDPTDADRVGTWMRWLTHEVVEDDVLHYGETIWFCDGTPPCAPGHPYLHTTFPHIWSQTEMYIALAFAYGLESCPPGLEHLGEAPCFGS